MTAAATEERVETAPETGYVILIASSGWDLDVRVERWIADEQPDDAADPCVDVVIRRLGEKAERIERVKASQLDHMAQSLAGAIATARRHGIIPPQRDAL